MNFFKKLFASKKAPVDQAAIEALLKPLVKHTTSIIVNEPKQEPENSPLISHFGGQPYLEEGESWPQNQNGKPLDFVFQVFNDSYEGIPENIKLIQFFYDFEEFPWENESDGWKSKIYEKLNTDKLIRIANPTDKPVKYCEITFRKALSLPNWEALGDLYPETFEQVDLLLGDDDYDTYEGACQAITGGEPDSLSSFGGYPAWIQGAESFEDAVGMPMDLLFQIDSEDNPNIMWGDMGLVYVFYDKTTGNIKFVLQCY